MRLLEFVHDLRWDDLPAAVQRQAQRCLLDIVGVAIAGRNTELSRIIHNFAAANFAGRSAYLWFDGREVSPPGAALANGMTIDAIDAHDGHNAVKGHAGAAVAPAVIATLDLDRRDAISGRELLTALVMGYEVALRAGEALHRTACDYHTSGAWNALGCAAVTARRLQLDDDGTRHALGIAEYHGPRSPMMRCIDFPTMLKDGSGWGAMAGVSAALMAREGFTGAPAQMIEGDEVADVWTDLSSRWRVAELYFKPHAVCRWAQPAIVAALALQAQQRVALQEINRIRVYTFHEATRLSQWRPLTTEEAQYSLPFPLAAALVHGEVGPAQLSGPGLHDGRVLKLAAAIELVEAPELSARFPGTRLARVEVELQNGAVLASPEMEATWEQHDAPGDDLLRDKFRRLAAGISPQRVVQLEELLWNCAAIPDAGELIAGLAPPPEASNQPPSIVTYRSL